MSLKGHAKSLLGRGLVWSGLHRAALGNNGVIVAFHRVNDTIPEDGLTLGSRRFEEFCRFFRDHYDVISLGDFIRRLRSSIPVDGALAITFDDGYLDNAQVAAPILQRVGLPATFFVTTSFLGSATVPFWDRELPRPMAWMGWDDIQLLSREGFDIGAHTRSHADLGIVDGEAARTEIFGSRQDLADHLGQPPAHFAYPFGGATNIIESNRDIVREAGFACCVSSYGGLAPNSADPYRLRRVPISPWFQSPSQFAFEVSTINHRRPIVAPS